MVKSIMVTHHKNCDTRLPFKHQRRDIHWIEPVSQTVMLGDALSMVHPPEEGFFPTNTCSPATPFISLLNEAGQLDLDLLRNARNFYVIFHVPVETGVVTHAVDIVGCMLELVDVDEWVGDQIHVTGSFDGNSVSFLLDPTTDLCDNVSVNFHEYNSYSDVTVPDAVVNQNPVHVIPH